MFDHELKLELNKTKKLVVFKRVPCQLENEACQKN